jgi:hypothetical protein
MEKFDDDVFLSLSDILAVAEASLDLITFAFSSTNQHMHLDYSTFEGTHHNFRLELPFYGFHPDLYLKRLAA